MGAVSAPVVGGALSKPLTGEVVPTRITDLVGYLTASGGAKGLAGFEDFESETSVGLPEGITAPPTVNAPKLGGPSAPGAATTPATPEKKRMLAVASLGGGLAIAALSFFLIRRLIS